MRRRQFFSSLLGISAVGVASAQKTAKANITDQKDVPTSGTITTGNNPPLDIMGATAASPYRKGNWNIFWTGWKEQQCSIDLVGQWVAVPSDKEWCRCNSRSCWGLYSSHPGSSGPFGRDEVFAIDWQQYQFGTMGHIYQDQADYDRAKGQALGILLEWVDQFPDHKISRPTDFQLNAYGGPPERPTDISKWGWEVLPEPTQRYLWKRDVVRGIEKSLVKAGWARS